MKKLNLIGKTYNRLTVIAPAEPHGPRQRVAWLCRCSCNAKTEKIILQENLRDGTTKSCGCWNQEQRSARAEKMYTTRIKYSPREATARRVHAANYAEMPFEDFFEMSQGNCFYCDIKPQNIQNDAKGQKGSSQKAKDTGDFIYNGLDRVDNSQNHSKENCVPCCKYCNWAKRERSTVDLDQWIERLYHNKNKRHELEIQKM